MIKGQHTRPAQVEMLEDEPDLPPRQPPVRIRKTVDTTWLRLILTWVVPVGLMTTVPAQALTGELSLGMLIGGGALAIALFAASSALFRFGLRRYASASS